MISLPRCMLSARRKTRSPPPPLFCDDLSGSPSYSTLSEIPLVGTVLRQKVPPFRLSGLKEMRLSTLRIDQYRRLTLLLASPHSRSELFRAHSTFQTFLFLVLSPGRPLSWPGESLPSADGSGTQKRPSRAFGFSQSRMNILRFAFVTPPIEEFSQFIGASLTNPF